MHHVPNVLKYLNSHHVESGVVRTLVCDADVSASLLSNGSIGLCVRRAGESACINLTATDARHLASELRRLAAALDADAGNADAGDTDAGDTDA